MLRDVQEYLRTAGDTTVTVSELGTMWASSEGSLRNAGNFIYGDTPMCACLREIVARFGANLLMQPRPTNNVCSLSCRMDSRPTAIARCFGHLAEDGGARRLRQFITDQDLRAAAELPATPDANWPTGARTLFDIASPVDALIEDAVDGSGPGDSWRDLLTRSGWTVPDGARLLAQVNHSETLADFMRIAATAMPARQMLRLSAGEKMMTSSIWRNESTTSFDVDGAGLVHLRRAMEAMRAGPESVVARATNVFFEGSIVISPSRSDRLSKRSCNSLARFV